MPELAIRGVSNTTVQTAKKYYKGYKVKVQVKVKHKAKSQRCTSRRRWEREDIIDLLFDSSVEFSYTGVLVWLELNVHGR